MRRFWKDRTAITVALVGAGLMILTIIWRINPAESSIVPRFLTSNPAGVTVIYVLLASCMPVWIPVVSLTMFIPFSEHAQYGIACGIMIVFQGILYFMLGKLVSLGARKLLKRRESSNQALHATSEPAPGAASSPHGGGR
jgi:hypothetical protein